MRRWFGDQNVWGPRYFGFDATRASTDIHSAQFEAVRKRLFDLHTAGKVSLVYLDDEGPETKVIAYRFTSDTAYYRYENELIELGGSLGRGIWDVFTHNGEWTYKEWIGRNAEAIKAAGK